MVRHRSSAAWVAVLLLIPLVGITAWLVHSALNPEPLQVPVLAPPDPSFHAIGSNTHRERLASRSPGFISSRKIVRTRRWRGRFSDFSVAKNCPFFGDWRIPPADLEILFFSSGEGAGKALAQDAGSDRTPGPGGWPLNPFFSAVVARIPV